MSLRFLPKSHQYRMTAKPGPATKGPTSANPELRVTGATTIINGGIPKPQLMPWYARQTAQFVYENPLEVERLRTLENDPEGLMFVKELAKAPDRVRDAAGERGTEVHDYAEQIIHGKAVDVPDDLLPYVEGYLRLIDEWEIEPILTETSIGNRQDWYAGRFDCLGRIGKLGGMVAMLDWKTSRNVYGETGLQTAGYSKAEFYVTDDQPEIEIPLPEIEATFVVHIKPHESLIYQLAANPAEIDRHFELFRAAAFTHKTTKEREAIITEPLTLPTITAHNLKAA